MTLAAVAIGALTRCSGGEVPAGEGPPLAEVGSRTLYLGDARGVVPAGTPAADSIAGLADYAERWARDAAVTLAAEAEDSLADAALERYVADYRDRLLRLRYEERAAARGVDTVVDDERLRALFADKQPVVDAPAGIARVILLRYGSDLPDREEFLEDWAMLRRDSAARDRVLEHAAAYAELALTDDAQWREVGTVAALADGLDPERIRDGANVRRGGTYLRVVDYIGPGQPAPLAYVRDRLRNTVVAERRADFLKAERARLYAEALARGEVKIYLPND